MAGVDSKMVVDHLGIVLREALEGPPGRSSYFTDHGAEAGLFGTLGGLDAASASRAIGGTTIAAHVHHVVFGLEASAAWIAGDRSPSDWKQSWSIATVDEAAWSALQGRLRQAYGYLLQVIERSAASSTDSMGGAIAAVAHVAYHLGAIRQKVGFAGS